MGAFCFGTADGNDCCRTKLGGSGSVTVEDTDKCWNAGGRAGPQVVWMTLSALALVSASSALS